MYAVVRTGGKQYRVQEGRSVRVDRLPGEPGEASNWPTCCCMAEGDDITIGTPNVTGARVLGTIAEQGRAKKIIVFRYKSKTRSRKKTGHRQHFTTIVDDDILAAGQQPKPKAAAQAPAATDAVSSPEDARPPQAEGRGAGTGHRGSRASARAGFDRRAGGAGRDGRGAGREAKARPQEGRVTTWHTKKA